MILTVRAPRHRAVRLTGVAGLTLALLTLGVPGIASAATPTCFGKKATIVGQSPAWNASMARLEPMSSSVWWTADHLRW